MSASQLLSQLLDYVLEQDKDVDPRRFNLSSDKGFVKGQSDLQGLPGVDFDIKVEGDHTWLRIARLQAHRPPALADIRWAGIIVASEDPNGAAPHMDEALLGQRLALALGSVPAPERLAVEAQYRALLQKALADHVLLWTAWAEGEKPRRKTISLYGDLFAIKHQLESEETAQPHELVWGVGVAAWKLRYEERSLASMVDFQYPLVTQAVELALDENTLAIELRPRAVDPRS
jgi:hypothetical protein